MDVIYSGLAALLLLLLTAWASHHLPETLVYIVSHFLLVRVMGKYHAHTRLGCMFMLKEKAAKLIVRIAEKAAENAVCKASPWDIFQPEESARVREWAEEKRKTGKLCDTAVVVLACFQGPA